MGKNILHISPALKFGGAEKLLVELANKQQEQRKSQVFLITFDRNDYLRPLHQIASGVGFYHLKRRFKFDFLTSKKLHDFICINNIDIIHTHSPGGLISILPIIIFERRTQIKFIHTVHSNYAYYAKLYNFLKRFSSFRRVSNVCLSPMIKLEYEEHYPRMKFYSIKNGISTIEATDRLPKVQQEVRLLSTNSKRLIYIGRNDKVKNLSLLFQTMESLLKGDVSCDLFCIGLDREEIIEEYNVDFILDKNTFIIGKKSNVGDYLKCSDALVLSSSLEGTPIVILEAMSAGLPIISTSVGGIPEIVEDGVNGYLSPELDSDSFSRTIKRFLKSDTDEIKQISKRNIQKFERHYSIDKCVEKYQEIYEFEKE